MKRKLMVLLGLSMFFAAGAVHAGEPMQMWNCGMENDVSEKDVEAKATAWKEAASKVDGGENIEVAIMWPVVVNATGETDFIFFVKMPSFNEWGKFWDTYPDSDAAANEGEGTFCPDSVLWDFNKL